jgi:PKD repeat protein
LIRKFALLAVVVAAVAAVGLGLNTRSASAAPGLAAVTGGPYAAVVGQAIQFDGTASSGLGGLAYAWTFGDGTSATGATPVKAYAAPGVYRVTLTVQDGAGATAVAATTATISGGHWFTGGCYTTINGVVVCGTGVSGVSGCVLTVNGWVCPGIGLPRPVVPGVVVSGSGYPGSSSPLPDCAQPAYMFTNYCLLLNKS